MAAKILEGSNRIKIGRLCKVENTTSPEFPFSSSIYYSVWVEDQDGSNERGLLLTENELQNALSRAGKKNDMVFQFGDSAEVKLKNRVERPGRIVLVRNKCKKHWKTSPVYFGILLTSVNDDNLGWLLFTVKEMDRIRQRSIKNQEDIPKKKFLSGFFN